MNVRSNIDMGRILYESAALIKISKTLTPDLLSPKWAGLADKTNRYSGHCYVAAEAVYHALGGRANGYRSYVLGHAQWPSALKAGETHWFIRHEPSGRIVDPTADQFTGRERTALPIMYELARSCGFLTKGPSKRAREVMRRMKDVDVLG